MSSIKFSCAGALCLVAIASLAACSKSDVPTADTFTAGMNTYLAQRGNLCLDKRQWPIDVTPEEMANHERNANQMPVFEKLGLVTSSDAVATYKTEEKSETVTVKRYVLTDEGKKYYIADVPLSSLENHPQKEPAGDFCAGKLSLDKVVSWTPPTTNDKGQKQTVVSYTYHIDPAPWMKTAEARGILPVVANIIDMAGKAQLEENFVLMPDGWRSVDVAG
jgi:hypothetical protein